ncbi:hypothetical protein IH979_03300, partial [Patescibacteria group bacterium]|nr:hypothetical protein [Patescibacteria group bacterium]
GIVPSPIAEGGPVLTVQLTSSAIAAPKLTATGTVAYYDAFDGRFYTIDQNGNILQLSDRKFPDAETVVFADSANIAAIEFPDGSNIIYDFETEIQTILPSHWTEFEFDPNAQEVVSKNLTSDPNRRSLVITSTDGTRTKVIAALGLKEDAVTLNWSPDGNVVGFSATGTVQTGFGRNEIFLIDTNGEVAGSLVVEGNHFSPLWSPSGSHLLYSVADAANRYRPSLWYVRSSGNDIGADRRRIGVETWIEKCAFASETELYCAVPREVGDYSGEDPRLVTAPDDVYLINLTTGRSTLIGSPVLDLQMFNLSVTPDGSNLYFTDQQGRLNAMRLK